MPRGSSLLNDSTSISAITPAHALGSVDVTITQPDLTELTLVNGYTYVNPPTFDSIDPVEGTYEGGTSVELLGTKFGTPAVANDNFTGTTINPVKWTPGLGSGGSVTQNDKLIIIAPGGSSWTGSSVYSTGKFEISGDYDIQVDFDLVNLPSPTGSAVHDAAIYYSLGGGNYGTAYIRKEASGLNYRISVEWNNGANWYINSIPTSDTSGKLRLKRVGTTLYAYYWNWISSGFTEIGHCNPGYSGVISPYIQSISAYTGSLLTEVHYDNFFINSGTVVFKSLPITFGGESATSIILNDSTSISAITPAHALGSVDVTITQPDLTTLTLSGGYTYITSPSIDSIDPVEGGAGGGTSVTISGTDFGTPIITGDDFTGTTINNVLWNIWGTPTQNGTLFFPAYSNSGLVSYNPNKFKIGGDFDIQVDFNILTKNYSSTGNYMAKLQIVENPAVYNTHGSIVRYWNSAGDSFVSTVYLNGVQQGYKQTGGGNPSTGKLRLKRVGALLSTMYYDGAWNTYLSNKNFTTNDVYIFLNGDISISGSEVEIDNFIINSGTVVFESLPVKFGGVDATDIVLNSSTSISAITPAHALGSVDVTITQPDLSTITIPRGFEYIADSCGDGVCDISGGENTSTCASDCGNACFTNDMSSWWSGENNADDIFGSINGTLVNGTTFGSGKVGQAFSFDGVDDYISLSSIPINLSNDTFTISAWMKSDTLGAGVVFSEGENVYSTSTGWYFTLRSGWVGISGRNDASTEFAIINNTVSLTDTNWHHIAVTKTSGGVFAFYVDGIAYSPTTNTFSGGTFNKIGYASIGAYRRSQLEGFFDGKIDEVQIWKEALSAQEIGNIYSAGSMGTCNPLICGDGVCDLNEGENTTTCPSDCSNACFADPSDNMVSWWKAENNANDSYGSNNGTLVNGATFTTGKVGQAFSFDGVDDYVDFGDTSMFRQTFTLSAWVNKHDNEWYRFFNSNLGTGLGSTPFVRMSILPSGYLNLQVGSNDSYVLASSSNFLQNNVWEHVVFTVEGDGSNSTLKIYHNGQNVGTASGSHTSIDQDKRTTLGVLYYHIVNNTFLEYFDGEIDELTVWTRALTSTEISRLYDAGSSGSCVQHSGPHAGYSINEVVPASQISQSTDGNGIMAINFKVKDLESEPATLGTFQYSVDNGSSWNVPTNGDASLALSSGWTNNGGANYTTAIDWSGPTYLFTFNTKHADVSGIDGVDQADVQIRFLPSDANKSADSVAVSESFSVDNLAPATLTTANIISNPNGGDTDVLIGGAFTETNPGSNTFYLWLNSGGYGSGTTGDSSTAAPSSQNTDAETTLDGDDVISQVKIVHVDAFGN